jgi:hypothetical protein
VLALSLCSFAIFTPFYLDVLPLRPDMSVSEITVYSLDSWCFFSGAKWWSVKPDHVDVVPRLWMCFILQFYFKHCFLDLHVFQCDMHSWEKGRQWLWIPPEWGEAVACVLQKVISPLVCERLSYIEEHFYSFGLKLLVIKLNHSPIPFVWSVCLYYRMISVLSF